MQSNYISDPLLRRQLIPELNVFQEQLQGKNDELSQAIYNWSVAFLNSLRTKPAENFILNEVVVLKEYCDQLKKDLSDPLGFALLGEPIFLDENAVLSNDGFTYGSKSLYLFLSNLSAEEKTHSPVYGKQETAFKTEPHFFIKHAIKWVQKYDGYFAKKGIENTPYSPSDKIEKAYEACLKKEQDEALKQKEKAKKEAYAKKRQKWQKKEKERNDQAEAAFKKTMEEAEENRKKQEEAFREELKKDEAADAQKFKDLNELKEKEKAQRERMQKRADKLKEDFVNLKKQAEALKEDLKKAVKKGDELKVQEIILQQAVNKLEQSRNERERGWLSGMLKTAIFIGACWLGTYHLAPFLQGTSFNFIGDGFMAVSKIPI